jgi:hypothetical protein
MPYSLFSRTLLEQQTVKKAGNKVGNQKVDLVLVIYIQ